MDKRFHCDHCGEKISKTLYYQHKRLYYSSSTNSWRKSEGGSAEISTGHSCQNLPPDNFTFSSDEEDTSLDMGESMLD